MSGWTSRRVIDPKPVLRGPLRSDYGTGNRDELANAWDSVGKAKSVLRRAEHHAHAAEQHSKADTLAGHAEHSVAVDRVPSFTTTDSVTSTGVKVDKYGRSSYMKSREQKARKISRLDDKYQEKDESSQRSKRSPLREPNCQWEPAERDYSTSATTKRTDSVLDTTDPKAIRETERHFINDISPTDPSHEYQAYKYGGQRESASRKLAHVSVKVPRSQPHGSASSVFEPAKTHPHATASMKDPEHVSASQRGESYCAASSNSTFTVNSSHRRLKKSLKDVNKNSDDLNKLREIIRQQRSSKQQAKGDTEIPCRDIDPSASSDLDLLKKNRHEEEDPVIPREPSAYEASHTSAPLVRKVARAPPAHYKGFNEVEHKYHPPPPDPKTRRMAAEAKKKRKMKRDVAEAEKADINQNPSPDKQKLARQARVVAPAKKPSKADNQSDIISTRSWRVGQKAILRELGPNKMPKMGSSPPTTDKNMDLGGESTKADNAPKTDSHHTTKQLSAEAKAVLKDLHVDSEDEDAKSGQAETAESRGRSRPLSKRKRPQPAEITLEEKIKARHYDSDSVRAYIARQKADRRRRQDEEKEAQKVAHEKKQQQLRELYEKTKTSARSRSRSGKRDDTGMKKTEKQGGEGSDKENQGWSDEVSSSDGSTITVASAHERQDPEAIESLVSKYAGPASQAGPSAAEAETAGPAAAAPTISPDDIINKYLSGQTPEAIIEKYSQQAETIKAAYNTGAAAARPKTSLPSNHTMMERDALGYPKRPFSGAANVAVTSDYRERMSRVRALQNTAELLQNRLLHTATRFTNEMEHAVPHASDADTAKWAVRLDEHLYDDHYVSKYERMTAGRDYNVFNSDLPGVGSLGHAAHQQHEHRAQNEAAAKIQAAYRGHAVRQALDWTPANPDTQQSDISMVSIDSDSVLTDGEGASHMPAPNKVGASLSGYDFHAGAAYQPAPFREAFRASAAEPSSAVGGSGSAGWQNLRPVKPSYEWTAPQADPYSILNVYARRSRQHTTDQPSQPGYAFDAYPSSVASGAGAMRPLPVDPDTSGASDDNSTVASEPSYTDDFTAPHSKHASTHGSARSRSHISGARSPVSGRSATEKRSKLSSLHQSQLDKIGRPTSGHLSHHSDVRGSRSQRLHSSQQEVTYQDMEDDEDTFNTTLTPSLGSDEEDEPKSHHELSLIATPKQKSLSRQHADDGSELSVSSIGDEEEAYDTLGRPAYQAGYAAGRLSPGGLERRMAAELHLLESMDISMQQVTNVERSRAVTMAQQESVSLAQILKSRQQSHHHEMSSLQLRAAQETLEAQRQLEDARRRAADAAQNAAEAISKVRSEATTSLQDSSQRLIATQAEAARTTAEAARQLAEARLSSLGSPAAADPHALAAAAASAVATAMKQHFTYPAPKQLGVDFKAYEKSTQYSRRSQSDTSRTDVSRTDASYDSESFQSSYTASPTDTMKRSEKKSRKEDSITSDVRTASDLSNVKSASSVKSGSIVTASDATARSNKTGSSIHTDSGAAGGLSPRSKADSITEDLASEQDDYSVDFDTSITEEEMEKSLRDVLPAESYRKKLKRQPSQSELTYSSDEHSQSFNADGQFPTMPANMGGAARRLSFEEDSFTKFTVEMVRQYMREEETRAQHQSALLKLRQRALQEKTRAELAWLEQQKKHLRDKGADDVYPQIKKRRRGLLLRLQQEQAEIKRLQEASKAASKERQFLLKQSQEIARLRQSTQQVLRKMRHRHREYLLSSSPTLESSSVSQVREKMKRKGPSDDSAGETAAEEETSMRVEDETYDDTSRSPSPMKEGELSIQEVKTSSASDIAQKLKKMKLDGKYLTVREQKLRHRRKQVEELLAWKQQLDEEEAAIKRMEKELALFHRGRADDKDPPRKVVAIHKPSKAVERSQEVSIETEDVSKSTRQTTRLDSNVSLSATTPRTPRTPRADTIAEESLASEIASEVSIDEDLSMSQSGSTTATTERKKTTSISESVTTEIKTRTSVAEEISVSSIAEDIVSTEHSKKRTPEAGEESVTSINDEYYNETFESEASQSVTRTQTPTGTLSSRPSPAKKPVHPSVSPAKDGAKSPSKLPIKSGSPSPARKTSESESEDSYSVAETTSDQSDVEGRIRTLTEELKRRKLEAERLKKEQRKKQKEKLRAHEDSLKKQIEAYDTFIIQAKDDLDDPEDRDAVPPQIKQPSESKRLNKLDVDKTQTDSSGKSSRQSPEKSPSVDSISESTESPSKSRKTSSDSTVDKTEDKSEILEDIPEEVSQVGTEDSASERLHVSLPGQSVQFSLHEDTYSEDFTATRPSTSQKHLPEQDKAAVEEPPQSARTETEIAEDLSIQTARSATEKSESRAAPERPLSRSELKLDLEKSEADKSYIPTKSARSDSVKSIASDFTEDFETGSERSHSEDSRTETFSQRSDSHRSESRTSRSVSRADETKSYSDDESQSSAHTLSRRTPHEPVTGSIDTDDEVSEHLSDDEQDSSSHPLDFTKDVVAPELSQEPLDTLEPAASLPDMVEMSSLSQEEQEDVLADFKLGDRVLVGGVQPGTLRFKGPVSFTTGHWGGVELDAPEGRNDGSKDAIRYFDCKPNHGIFAPPEKLSHIPSEKDEDESDISQHTLTGDISAKSEDIKSATKDDEEESIAEDISVATVDSELERVISSAAAAVEEFNAGHEEAPSPDHTSEGHSPRGLQDEVADLPTEERVNSSLDMLDLTTQNLLNESISQMLGIYNKKKTSTDLQLKKEELLITPPEEQEEKADTPKPSPTEEVQTSPSSPTTPTTPDDDGIKLRIPSEEMLEDDIFKTRIIMEPQNFPELAPARPSFLEEDKATQDDLDKLYDELGALSGDSDEWFDDDFGLGLKQKDPPPYPSQEPTGSIGDLRLDLQKVSQLPFYAVPHKADQVGPLAGNAVEVYWEKRRYGESWTEVDVPETYFSSEDRGGDMESRSKKAYKKLVFDLSGDVLRDVYQDEEQTEPAPWQKPKRVRKKYYRGLSPPRTQEGIEPIVQKQVCGLVGADKGTPRTSRINKWSCRKKRDHVDKVLLQELAEEEPDWVDYNDDELTVKMQIADSIFDALLAETGRVLEDAVLRKTDKLQD